MFVLLYFFTLLTAKVQSNSQHDCDKLFNPVNYVSQLPSLHMPYLDNIPIKPSPVLTTKVVSVVTKYVYKNPVCVKVSGKKSLCKSLNPQVINIDHLVTKELFVRDRKLKSGAFNRIEDDLNLYLQGSEEPRPFMIQQTTPKLTSEEIKNVLIEDRLDQLEKILPHYTRRRVFETTTVTVTKVRSNNRATATLLVKNCVPQGYDLCPPKVKNRASIISTINNSVERSNFKHS